jgi:heat shock protein HslJ
MAIPQSHDRVSLMVGLVGNARSVSVDAQTDVSGRSGCNVGFGSLSLRETRQRILRLHSARTVGHVS